jgi:hypothetical protein
MQQTYEKISQLNLNELCFDKQLAFLTDKSLFAMAVTSRRAGKTTACALHLLNTAMSTSKCVCLYIAPARTNAKKIIWPMLHEFNREYELGAISNESDLSFRFTNGSMIYVSGAATAGEVDRFRGLALKLTYVDESQDFGNYLEQLINDVLVPASFDNKGQIRLIGTPGPVPVGYYYDAYQSKGWSHHAWTIFDNPWIQRKRGESAQALLEQEMERRGVDESDPTIQREIFGRFVVDTKRLVIDYNPSINDFDTLPASVNRFILGIDLGFNDADAIAVLGYGDASYTTYLVDECIETKQGLTELVHQVERLVSIYKPYKMMIDAGGIGKKLAEEMRRRYKIPVQDADKKRKFENIEILNDCLRTQRFMAKKTSRFANDSRLMEWDFDKITPDKRVVSDRFHSDIIDAVLYGFKESPAFTWEAPQIKPKIGTERWGREEEARMFESELERFTKQESDSQLGLEWI